MKDYHDRGSLLIPETLRRKSLVSGIGSKGTCMSRGKLGHLREAPLWIDVCGSDNINFRPISTHIG